KRQMTNANVSTGGAAQQGFDMTGSGEYPLPDTSKKVYGGGDRGRNAGGQSGFNDTGMYPPDGLIQEDRTYNSMGMADDQRNRVNQRRIQGRAGPAGDGYAGQYNTEGHRKHPQTFDEVIRTAPPEVQAKFQYLQQVEQREK